jgi:hypothetical protein
MPGECPSTGVQANARSELDRPITELDPPREIEPHDADNILDLEGAGEERMAHMAAGRVVQFNFLQMKLRRRKPVECSDVVVMHVGQNHVGNTIVVEPDQCQRFSGTTQMAPPTRSRDFGSEAGVDHKAVLAAYCGPNEIIHRHWAVMRVAADKMIRTPGVALGIADGIEFVFGEMAVHGAASGLSTRINGKDCGGAAAVQA